MKILVGYEESKVAEEALKVALKQARAFNADLFIVTVLEQSRELQKEDIEAAEDRLEKLKRTHNINDLVCETSASVSFLSPGEYLVEFAQDNNIDEIVIGVKRRSKVGKLVFGSNAQFVILSSPCPVITVT
jgi:nucleotide-binding universal stress UspA family protein